MPSHNHRGTWCLGFVSPWLMLALALPSPAYALRASIEGHEGAVAAGLEEPPAIPQAILDVIGSGLSIPAYTEEEVRRIRHAADYNALQQLGPKWTRYGDDNDQVTIIVGRGLVHPGGPLLPRGGMNGQNVQATVAMVIVPKTVAMMRALESLRNASPKFLLQDPVADWVAPLPVGYQRWVKPSDQGGMLSASHISQQATVFRRSLIQQLRNGDKPKSLYVAGMTVHWLLGRTDRLGLAVELASHPFVLLPPRLIRKPQVLSDHMAVTVLSSPRGQSVSSLLAQGQSLYISVRSPEPSAKQPTWIVPIYVHGDSEIQEMLERQLSGIDGVTFVVQRLGLNTLSTLQRPGLVFRQRGYRLTKGQQRAIHDAGLGVIVLPKAVEAARNAVRPLAAAAAAYAPELIPHLPDYRVSMGFTRDDEGYWTLNFFV